jgi:hypothetical protein
MLVHNRPKLKIENLILDIVLLDDVFYVLGCASSNEGMIVNVYVGSVWHVAIVT